MKTLKVSWSSPSNIALVKYWGKKPVQIPANPSISFTLKHSMTILEVEAELVDAQSSPQVYFLFEGVENEKFKNKIVNFLTSQISRFPWVLTHKLVMRSKNTFPHSSGIASSASSMSALSLCILSLDELIQHKKIPLTQFRQEASFLSRLASGSAGRSVYPYMACWGHLDSLLESSDEFASPVSRDQFHPLFHHFCDSIAIVDEHEKSVSSRAGHALMDEHPFKQVRFDRARKNMQKLIDAMKVGDMDTFIEIVEEEALMLHALMMTSRPSYILLKPMSLELIEKMRAFRARSHVPVCFTIDAGPNIHFLYPEKYKNDVKLWLAEEFPQLKVIHDEVGEGPVSL